MNGQITIAEYLDSIEPLMVDIVGLCDDAACPKCGYEFMDPKENDLPACPICGCKVDWARWHYVNDPEVENELTEGRHNQV